MKAGAIGLSTALLVSLAAQRSGRFPAYRALTLPLKAFAVTSVTTASFIIGADAASRQFELSKYAVGSGTEMERESHMAERAEEEAGISEQAGYKRPVDLRTLSTRDAIVEWSKANRYKVVFVGWASTMIGSFAYISMTPLSFAQKLVQVRRSLPTSSIASPLISFGGTLRIVTNGRPGTHCCRSDSVSWPESDTDSRWGRARGGGTTSPAGELDLQMEEGIAS